MTAPLYVLSAFLSPLPYVGSIVGIVLATWWIVSASVEVHGIERQRALIVFGAIGILMLLSSLGSERAARELDVRFEGMDRSMENMTAEEAGEVMGRFLKGVEKGSRNGPSDPQE